MFLVQIVSLSQELHVLPTAGGLFDQDCYLVLAMFPVLEAISKQRKKETDKELAKIKKS